MRSAQQGDHVPDPTAGCPDCAFDTKHDPYLVPAVHGILTRPADGRVRLMRRAGSGDADGATRTAGWASRSRRYSTESAIQNVREAGVQLDRAELKPAASCIGLSLEPQADIFFTVNVWIGILKIDGNWSDR
jgi:hypothetical protein